ncbi:hypothetical protein LG277_10875 [Vreelandella aquamarina]|uniref:hypothetical protein n=1 Tax=Vreelandella aquamarina TaxID=77097 RepID=UPI0038508BFD
MEYLASDQFDSCQRAGIRQGRPPQVAKFLQSAVQPRHGRRVGWVVLGVVGVVMAVSFVNRES